jgi:hypothetical protein
MKNIFILEPEDIINPEDWVRPLYFPQSTYGDQIFINSINEYSGTPEGNIKWIKVKDFMGDFWYGKTIKEFHDGYSKAYNIELRFSKYEFIRGEIPDDHIWAWRKK